MKGEVTSTDIWINFLAILACGESAAEFFSSSSSKYMYILEI